MMDANNVLSAYRESCVVRSIEQLASFRSIDVLTHCPARVRPKRGNRAVEQEIGPDRSLKIWSYFYIYCTTEPLAPVRFARFHPRQALLSDGSRRCVAHISQASALWRRGLRVRRARIRPRADLQASAVLPRSGPEAECPGAQGTARSSAPLQSRLALSAKTIRSNVPRTEYLA
jgi:hypothetical protein